MLSWRGDDVCGKNGGPGHNKPRRVGRQGESACEADIVQTLSTHTISFVVIRLPCICRLIHLFLFVSRSKIHRLERRIFAFLLILTIGYRSTERIEKSISIIRLFLIASIRYGIWTSKPGCISVGIMTTCSRIRCFSHIIIINNANITIADCLIGESLLNE